jgi:hypothetical protein
MWLNCCGSGTAFTLLPVLNSILHPFNQLNLKTFFMKKIIQLSISLFVVFLYSCHKQDVPATDRSPYQIEKINKDNFSASGWRKQQVNIVSGVTTFTEQFDNVQVVCGPENNSEPWLRQGCVTMNLPTSDDATLRRIRLWKSGYSGTRLADLTELKYSTYVVKNAPTILVLAIDINNDGVRDFNIYYSPQQYNQGTSYIAMQFNNWQQWDALKGIWNIEVAHLPEFPNDQCTLQQLISLPQYADAKIIDVPVAGQDGEGIRLTIGGTPRDLYDNTVGYFDALIIGIKGRERSTLYDFSCN